MKHSVETFKGDDFFQNNRLLYVNRASENFLSPLHDHDFIEFAYVAEGAGFHHIGGEVHKVRQGQLFVIPIGISHVFRPTSSDLSKHPLIVYNCLCTSLLLRKLAGFASDRSISDFARSLLSSSQPFLTYSDTGGESVDKLFRSLHQEYAMPQSGSADYLHALLLQLLIQIHRLQQNPAQGEPARVHAQFDHVLRYMENHLEQEITLARLARISRWSERHLQRLFKSHTGQTFNRCLQSMRVLKSCELLRSSQLKISSIAEAAGYRDMDSFIAVFKRNTGRTPSEYRRG